MGGWTMRNKSDEVKLGSLFNGNPSLKELLEHIQTAYPDFWALVFANLEKGLIQFYASFVVFLFICILIAFYGCSLCCCRPYTIREAATDGKLSTNAKPKKL